MKFTTTINELRKAIALLSPITNYVPSEKYILIRNKGDRIELKAFSDIAVASAFVSCQLIEGEGSIYVLGKHFIGLINNFESGDITFDITDNCKITCKKSKYSLKTLSEDIPIEIDYYSISKEQGAEINVNLFKTAFSSIQHWIGRNFDANDFQNIYFCDGKMIACSESGGGFYYFDTKNIEKLTLHKRACALINNLKNQPSISIIKENGRVYGISDNFIFVVISSDSYPYDQFKEMVLKPLGEEKKITFKFPSDEMTEKLTRVLMFSDDYNAVRLQVRDNNLIVSARDTGEAEEIIELSDKCENFSIDVDGKNLLESVSKFSGDICYKTNDSNDVQFLSDDCLVQFYLGLE